MKKAQETQIYYQPKVSKMYFARKRTHSTDIEFSVRGGSGILQSPSTATARDMPKKSRNAEKRIGSLLFKNSGSGSFYKPSGFSKEQRAPDLQKRASSKAGVKIPDFIRPKPKILEKEPSPFDTVDSDDDENEDISILESSFDQDAFQKKLDDGSLSDLSDDDFSFNVESFDQNDNKILENRLERKQVQETSKNLNNLQEEDWATDEENSSQEDQADEESPSRDRFCLKSALDKLEVLAEKGMTYQEFQEVFIPKKRKATFTEHCYFRIFEKHLEICE